MSKTEKEIGHRGEEAVCQYLIEHGYEIKARNFCIRGGEIDIVAAQDNLYVFCEVKTRKNDAYAPSEAVNRAKQRRILQTAEAYLYQHKLFEVDVRFDVAQVIYQNQWHIDYIENAFWKEG